MLRAESIKNCLPDRDPYDLQRAITRLETRHINTLLKNMGWCRYVLNMLNLYNLNVHHVHIRGMSTREIPCVQYLSMVTPNLILPREDVKGD